MLYVDLGRLGWLGNGVYGFCSILGRQWKYYIYPRDGQLLWVNGRFFLDRERQVMSEFEARR